MAQKRTVTPPKRGEIWLVQFDPTIGREIKKTRPAVIVQNDIGNRVSEITIVAAVTSQKEAVHYPVNVFVKKGEGGLTSNSAILLNQVRSIDRRRLVRRMGKLSTGTLRHVDHALLISLGLVDVS